MAYNPDVALENLRRIKAEFADFVSDKDTVSEADTRANLIDKILIQVCCWPENAIRREEHVHCGYIDYSLLAQTRPYVAVEAKKAGLAFVFPTTTHKTLKLSGSILTDKHIADAIAQVRAYCDDGGIRYAVATNGSAWVVFRAIREDMPWREASARIFPSLDYIESNFVEFWNLLSYEAIQRGALDEEFGNRLTVPRGLDRVVSKLFNADLPLQRNRLHAQLHPLIETIFQDIADQDPLEILQSCYVHTGSLKVAAQDIDAVITDSIPAFLLDQGTEPVIQSATDAGRFGQAISQALSTQSGQLYILLGGIGSGKTTFTKRYQRAVGKPVLDRHALWFHLDFLEAPLDPQTVEAFVWEKVLVQLRSRYERLNLETRRNIKKAFADNIEVLSQTLLRSHAWIAGDTYEDSLSPHLEKWRSDALEYVPRLLRVAKGDRRVQVVLFIDNVDQLSPAYQAQVFMLAQRMTRAIGSLTILALREESYYTATLQKTLTAYTNRKFHIASPRFRKMIDNRIRFALDILEKSQGPVKYVLRDSALTDRRSVAELLRIVETSIFEQNHNIARFIEAICFGNMRMALDMFTTFMTSGATDVDKMLNIYRRSGAYFVAFHEFVKSIMLGDRRYYKDEASVIMNLFDCGAERNASHFSCLRIIRALSQRRGEATREGQGYVEIARLVGMSEDVFDNREDLLRSLNRLVAKQLIEANTKSTDTIAGASHVRVTSAGWYYARYLVSAFSYLDLVLQDTPLNDSAVEAKLRGYVQQVDNLSDREDQKLDRMTVRFTRVRTFLNYLDSEEEREFQLYDLTRRGGIWAEPFVPAIRATIDSEVGWIGRRLRENRERIAEDISLSVDGKEAEEFDIIEPDDDDDESAHETAVDTPSNAELK